MKKIIMVLISLILSINLVACSKGYDEIPEKYIYSIFNGESEVFFKEYSSDLFKRLYIGSDEDFEKYIANLEKNSDEQYELNEKFNKKYEYKNYEVYKEFSSDELKDYNKYYENQDVERFDELIQLIVYYEEYKDNELVKEHQKGMLIGKYRGEWKLIRFFG